MKIEVDPDDVATYRTDDRGRLTLGVEYGEKAVEIAILGVQEEENDA